MNRANCWCANTWDNSLVEVGWKPNELRYCCCFPTYCYRNLRYMWAEVDGSLIVNEPVIVHIFFNRHYNP
jgi:hypothetical protein